MSSASPIATEPIAYLSRFLLSPETPPFLSPEEFKACLPLAHRHHVVMRWLRGLSGTESGQNAAVAEWTQSALAEEETRIVRALGFLEAICDELSRRGCEVTVIKSLDHWTDLGSDLDLYSNAPSRHVIRAMKEGFKAELAPRSWGDRLAGKWNFIVPGLAEAVEVHVGRLVQTGEHVSWAAGIPSRAVRVQRAHCAFRAAAPEDRLMISTLQRMYRHFYFRLCDILDSAQLIESVVVDFARLRRYSQEAGIWSGVATYLVIVSDYTEAYGRESLALPPSVRMASAFGGEQLSFKRGFLRVPIIPHSVALYTREWGTLARRGELPETLRLSLLPYLAAAAALGEKLTGRDKGIW